MSRRSGIQPLTASPVLVGAVTLLVSIVAVFLSYNANAGLPFVPTYDLRAELPNAANLVKGNEVRIGGARVGVIEEITPVPSETGRLDRPAQPQAGQAGRAGAGGLHADRPPAFRAGAQVRGAHPRAVAGRLRGGRDHPDRPGHPRAGGDGRVLQHLRRRHAARGPAEPQRLRHRPRGPRARPQRGDRGVQPAAGATWSRWRPTCRTRGRSWPGSSPRWRNTAGEVAPVADRAGGAVRQPGHHVHRSGGRSRGHSSRSSSPRARPRSTPASAEFPKQRPFLRNTAAFLRELRPGVSCAAGGGSVAGRRVRGRDPHAPAHAGAQPPCDERLRGRSTRRSLEPPAVPQGVERLRLTVTSLRPTLAFVAPAQTVCNYATLFFRNAASHLSQGDANGTFQRFSIITPPQGPNNEGGPASAPANGPARENYLHRNAYPNTAVAGSAARVRGRQRDVPARAPSAGQRARQPGHVHQRAEGHQRPERRWLGVRRHGQGRFSRLQTGVIALLVLAVATYFAFARDIPFTKPYEVKAMFDNTSTLGLNSPVRIAGVNVGKVAKVEPAGDDSTMSVVTMKIDKKGLPIHDDAELKIRPRIFFGGNFFVDVKPGTPGARRAGLRRHDPGHPDLRAGAAGRGARRTALGHPQGPPEAARRATARRSRASPSPARTTTRTPTPRARPPAKSLNDSLEDAPEALRGTAIVNQALLGTERRDLSKLIAGGQKVAAALASRETQLKDLISNFNTTTGALAAEQANLRRTIRLLPRGARRGQPGLRQAQRLVPAHARVRARDHPGRPRDRRPRSRRRCPGSRRRASCCPRPSSRASSRDLQPATRRPGRVHRRLRAASCPRQSWSTAA